MATSLTSDAFHDFPCTSCAGDDINKDAIIVCVTCNQYFCKTCLKFHNRMTGGKDHQCIDKDEFGHVTTASSQKGKPDLPTEKCTKHHGKLIDMFCEDHDVVGCNVCIALDHRDCKDLFYIPDIATSRLPDKTVQSAERDLSQHLCKIKTLRDDRHDHKSRLSREKDLAIGSTKCRRKQIDEYLDNREHAIYENISDKYEESCENLDADINTFDATITVLEKMNSKLKIESDTNNLCQMFVNVKGVGQTVKEAERIWQASNDKINYLPKITFQAGNDISDILVQETLFGRVVVKNAFPTGLHHVENVNIRYPDDPNTCDCKDFCQLPSGTFILTDWNNSKIKSLKYDTTNKLSGQLLMSCTPWGVCAVNEKEVAVTMPYRQTVTLVSVDVGGLSITNSFNVTNWCTGIIHVDGRLYIGDLSKANIKVYDVNGTFFKFVFHRPGRIGII